MVVLYAIVALVHTVVIVLAIEKAVVAGRKADKISPTTEEKMLQISKLNRISAMWWLITAGAAVSLSLISAILSAS